MKPFSDLSFKAGQRFSPFWCNDKNRFLCERLPCERCDSKSKGREVIISFRVPCVEDLARMYRLPVSDVLKEVGRDFIRGRIGFGASSDIELAKEQETFSLGTEKQWAVLEGVAP